MPKIALTLCALDSATPALHLAQELLHNSLVEARPFPTEASIAVRMHRAGEAKITAETVPSPAFLRWLADYLEADLAARG